MSLLGTDFNSSTPVDGDFTQRLSGPQVATELRDLKSRIKSFFSVGFRIGGEDSGMDPDENPRASSIPNSALKDLSPSPESGTQPWRKMTVNQKGLVTGGNLTDDITRPRWHMAMFFGAKWNGTSYVSYNGVGFKGGSYVDADDRRFAADLLANGVEPIGSNPFPDPPGLQGDYNFQAADAKCTRFRVVFNNKILPRIKFTVIGGDWGDRSRVISQTGSGILQTPTLHLGVSEASGGVSVVGPFKQDKWVFSHCGLGSPWSSTLVHNPVYSETSGSTKSQIPGYGGDSGPGIVILEWFA